VEDVGDSEFLIDEVVDKFRFMASNHTLTDDGRRPASGRPLLLGITKASRSARRSPKFRGQVTAESPFIRLSRWAARRGTFALI